MVEVVKAYFIPCAVDSHSALMIRPGPNFCGECLFEVYGYNSFEPKDGHQAISKLIPEPVHLATALGGEDRELQSSFLRPTSGTFPVSSLRQGQRNGKRH